MNDDRVFMVTGANTGIGRVTALELARQGGHVIMACRSEERTLPVRDEIRSSTGNPNVEFLKLDLASLASVREAAAAFLGRDLPLHVLVNNAGLAGARGQTADGFELAFGVNHLGHFLLTLLLMERLTASAPARVVHVASRAHTRLRRPIDFDVLRGPTRTRVGLREYAVSKLANVLFSRELAERVRSRRVHSYALHPGVVASDVWRKVPWPARALMKRLMLTNEEGAATTLFCATSAEVAHETGLYYSDCRRKEPSEFATNDALAKELWMRSAAWANVDLAGG
ncbi:MAG: SDR family oxidoreductase [Myxococcota bacterium]